ncbi:endonuclease/exonuclease/phosphatase family protein [Sphingomonas donggukensis]|uniref:Endonuclease/exonuclease/phosphatase family protein n=1 Tax=Sphingomonas donggukensis TaxID=2949093 RepID=A0ABY4TY64_9SPHN|nr:endonuclease/exonuclease/phosphatase family protein [Sphingomonas donggukensis]URW75486.1 endonuclease/exonuclease/phosphatase family protein [Sphingomonas donggukensis]
MIVLLLAAAAAPASPSPLRVMSFNVRLPVEADGANRWEARRDIAAAAVRRARPDVIGTQELHKRQGDDLIARLPGYAWFGIDRRGGHADEHMGVVYNRRTIRLVQFGEFWLSDTPTIPGSISWGHPYPRMVTWAIFERVRDKRQFRLLDTHLPYRAEDEGAREKGAQMIVARLTTLPGADLPTVLTGDFNTTPDSATYATLTAALADTRPAAARRDGPEATFHNYTGVADRRIDWILARGFTPLTAKTLNDHKGPVWASDHFPILAELNFTR